MSYSPRATPRDRYDLGWGSRFVVISTTTTSTTATTTTTTATSIVVVFVSNWVLTVDGCRLTFCRFCVKVVKSEKKGENQTMESR